MEWYIYLVRKYAHLAQGIERESSKFSVIGSNPIMGANP